MTCMDAIMTCAEAICVLCKTSRMYVFAESVYPAHAANANRVASDIASQMEPFAPLAFCKTGYVG